MSEIRQNRLTGEWVIIAPERAKRGGNLAVAPLERAEIPTFVATCPFCPGNEVLNEERFRFPDGLLPITSHPSSITAPPAAPWLLRSVVNKFSVLSNAGELSETSRGLCESVNGVGLHEVLVESPLHHLSLGLFPADHLQRILEAYLHRFRAFHADPRVRHVIVFKNHGADAGASQQHPHSQIVGLPIVPGQVVDRIERARRFFAETGCCLGCTLLAEEKENQTRLISENEHFVAFVPYAALSPYHLWIFPKVHAACFSALPAAALPALAEMLRLILGKIHGLLDNPPFNLVIRSLGPDDPAAPFFHWYISIVPRVNKTAGFELGTGMYVNPSSPEDRAQELREFQAP